MFKNQDHLQKSWQDFFKALESINPRILESFA